MLEFIDESTQTRAVISPIAVAYDSLFSDSYLDSLLSEISKIVVKSGRQSETTQHRLHYLSLLVSARVRKAADDVVNSLVDFAGAEELSIDVLKTHFSNVTDSLCSKIKTDVLDIFAECVDLREEIESVVTKNITDFLESFTEDYLSFDVSSLLEDTTADDLIESGSFDEFFAELSRRGLANLDLADIKESIKRDIKDTRFAEVNQRAHEIIEQLTDTFSIILDGAFKKNEDLYELKSSLSEMSRDFVISVVRSVAEL